MRPHSKNGTTWLVSDEKEVIAVMDTRDFNTHVAGTSVTEWTWNHPRGILRRRDSKLLHRLILGMNQRYNGCVHFANGDKTDVRRDNMVLSTSRYTEASKANRKIKFFHEKTGRPVGVKLCQHNKGVSTVRASYKGRIKQFSPSRNGGLETAYKLAIAWRLHQAEMDGQYVSIPNTATFTPHEMQ